MGWIARFLTLSLFSLGLACGSGGSDDDGDDGDDIQDGAVPPDAAPRCGDGNVDPGEGCDDGNTVDDDACRNTCALPTCGDGVVQTGEDCDDMNAVETDACLATCMAASCGDSQVHAGVEACDDGNTVDEGVCNPDCTVAGCATGTAACDAIPNNGCETDTTTSEEHCGGCDTPCAPANGVGACVGSACTVMACLTPYSDCNGMVPDGCEADLSSDPDTCGSCMTSCVAPNTTATCSSFNCMVTGCDPFYGDCEPVFGCETNLLNDVNHCGDCATACSQAHGTSECLAGDCNIIACDTGWADCNLFAEDSCEEDTTTSLAHCGGCNLPCNLANAAETCVASDCALGACDAGFSNCNGFEADGCEAELATDVDHCGTCAIDCDNVYPNSSVSCSGGGCQFNGCLPNFYNIDGNLANGCEYGCTFVSTTDAPDNSFVDTNCDGIDGDVNAAVFVATNGSDVNPGTKAQPMQTIMAGIARAVATGKNQVYVSNGTYFGRVSLTNGISLYGGYSASNNWARASFYTSTIRSTTVANGRMTALDGLNLTSVTIVDRLTIETANTTAAGTSNYAVYCNNCDALTIRNCDIDAGSAGAGTGGTAGVAGASGGNALSGGLGSCDGTSPGAGGSGGTSSCGRTGGNGGPGAPDGPFNGANGGIGVVGTPGGAGGFGGDPGGDGGNGVNGNSGGTGSSGSSGTGGTAATNFWVSNNGGTGGTGNHGNGGGGGGGGGGQGCPIFCIDGPGNGGGGGGAGGCGGTGGTGGTGGGGSFGVFLVGSTGVALVANSISSGAGGGGGNGGNGAGGGTGGTRGLGGNACTSEVGAGGAGGLGGAGGQGAGGGGGAGGPSWAVFRVATTVSTSGNTLNNSAPGPGGPGGFPNGQGGSAGSSGTVN